MSNTIRYGLIGCGGFGRFCLEAYQSLEGMQCVAVADQDAALAHFTAAQTGLEACGSPDELLARQDIDLVHLATPPFTHASLATAALNAGKHVLCEKPLALNLQDASAMIHLAAEKKRILAVNLIMRYNPLCRAVKAVIDSRILGAPVHASLINSAKDEPLPAAHWFWDREKSGGIFIEHGVHFFDLFEWWFGSGTLLSAHQVHRPDSRIVDQVLASVQYGGGVLGTFYHGFHQLGRRDEQTWRLIFELGTITLTEWVPTEMKLDVSLSDAEFEKLTALLPGVRVQLLERYPAEDSHARSRHRDRLVEVHAGMTLDAGFAKQELYAKMLRDLMTDQLAAIRDPAHVRVVGERNGLTSLAYAVSAQMAAGAGGVL
ncbi:MAG: putative dehydrogenase [Verrucomicrobiales bacterium]|nr:putative dehydrogenase [Verrucomicrobiales bacterium]